MSHSIENIWITYVNIIDNISLYKGRKGGRRCIHSCWWLFNNRPQRTTRTKRKQGKINYLLNLKINKKFSDLTLILPFLTGRSRASWRIWDYSEMHTVLHPPHIHRSCIHANDTLFPLTFRVQLDHQDKKENMGFLVGRLDLFIYYISFHYFINVSLFSLSYCSLEFLF